MKTETVTLHLPILKQPVKLAVFRTGDNHVSKTLKQEGIWEAFETSLLVSCLQSGDTVLDIGANIGYYTVIAGRCVSSAGKVLAFEPGSANFRLLEKNISANKLVNTQVFQLALSDKNQQGKLYLSDDNYGDHQIYTNNERRDVEHIKLAIGDSLLADTKTVNFIKIDTQGAEWQVLQGLQQTIANNIASLCMIVEFSPNSLRLAGSSPIELLNYLFSLNLPVYLIDHIGHQLVTTTLDEMKWWAHATTENQADMGFFNLFIGKPPSDIAIKADA